MLSNGSVIFLNTASFSNRNTTPVERRPATTFPFVSVEPVSLRRTPLALVSLLPSIADSPLYLSKSIRIRQIRVERKACHSKINRHFPATSPPSCFVGGKRLMSDQAPVVGGQRLSPGWQSTLSNGSYQGPCNDTRLWSALAYRKRARFHTTHESPWYFLFHLLPKETVSDSAHVASHSPCSIGNRWSAAIESENTTI